MKCQEAIERMHDVLDDDITPEQEAHLHEHIAECEACQVHFYELKKTTMFVQSLATMQPSADFTSRVMQQLPKQKRSVRVKRWMQLHPALVAAGIFGLLVVGSLSTLSEDVEFAVTKQKNVIVRDHTAIVPAGKVVEGDIVVKNGDIDIRGEVKGDVVVINGEQHVAKAGKVTGQIEEINEAFDVLWFKIKESVTKVFD